MNYHKNDNKMKCHYCGKEETLSECPECHSKFLSKDGIGSQRVEEFVKELFKDARVLRMDLDTTKNKDSHLKYVEQIRNLEVDIIVGTQMVAKGLDFPNVTLVAVLSIDSSLNSSDYRAKEKAYQLLVQVLGRAGRSDKDGIALIQTYQPDNKVLLQASNYDYEDFYKNELSYRKRLSYPPFRTIAYLLFMGKDCGELYKFAKETKLYLDSLDEKEFEVLGPSVPYISKINNVYRMKLMCKYRDNKKAIQIFKELKERNLKNNKIKISVVVNPSNDI
jgi:primosomal protein N' (replication factor Y)